MIAASSNSFLEIAFDQNMYNSQFAIFFILISTPREWVYLLLPIWRRLIKTSSLCLCSPNNISHHYGTRWRYPPLYPTILATKMRQMAGFSLKKICWCKKSCELFKYTQLNRMGESKCLFGHNIKTIVMKLNGSLQFSSRCVWKV